MSEETAKCAVCNVFATLKCMACRTVYYCGKEHQKIHWRQGHKGKCKCYEIAIDNVLGRHLRATRDIKCGEVILRESPLVYGPKTVSVPVCLGCHRQLATTFKDNDNNQNNNQNNNNYYKCRQCNWPLCDQNCERSSLHRDECQLMMKRKFRANIDYSNGCRKESAYCAILPLRCILLKEKDPVMYEKFASLQDHLDEWLQTSIYQVLKRNLIPFLRNVLNISTDWSEMDILRVAARLDTNAFEIRLPEEKKKGGSKIRAIFPTAAMFSHDCLPNARHTFTDDMEIIFVAKMAIRKGEIISTTYTQLLNSTPIRLQHLMQTKHFKCQCRRCSDPTELGLYIGAIHCRKCYRGKMISIEPLEEMAKWQCELCGHHLSAKQINLGNESLQKEISHLLNKKTPKQFEEFLVRYDDILHSTNTFALQVKYALTQLYGNSPGFLLHEMNAAAINRKVELCRELLTVADIIDGGWSIFRGQLLLDLQEALAIQAKQQYLNDLLTREGVQEQLTESMNLLKECTDIMTFVPGMNEILRKRTTKLANELIEDDF